MTASRQVHGGCEADRRARRRRRYCQRERLGRGRATAVKGRDRYRVCPRWVCVCHAHHARRRIAFQLAFEVGGGGNSDSRRVGWRGIRRNSRVGAERN